MKKVTDRLIKSFINFGNEGWIVNIDTCKIPSEFSISISNRILAKIKKG